jgi:hypothetical protein
VSESLKAVFRKITAAVRQENPWLVVLLSLPAAAPLCQPGYFWGAHDARHSLYFLYEFDKMIRAGVLYPRWGWGWAFGYGYPFWNIYGPLSTYFGELFHLLGFDIMDSVKIVFGLSIILSGLSMYLFCRRLFGEKGGLVASLLYVYFPYHFFDLYVRAALAESVGFVFVPLVCWGFYELVIQPKTKTIALTAAAFAALMLTSNLLALLLTPILGLFTLAYLIKESLVRRRNGLALRLNLRELIHQGLPPAAGLLLGIGLSGLFVLPALTEAGFIRVDQWVGGRYTFGKDWVEIFQLFSPRWGFGASIPGPDDQAGFQLGLVLIVLFVCSFFSRPVFHSRNVHFFIRFMQIASLVIIFLMVPPSEFLWRTLPLTSIAQFPWRLLALAGMTLSIVGGSIMPVEGAGSRKTLAIMVTIILLSSYPYIKAEVRDPRPNEGPVSDSALFRFEQSSDEMTGSTAWTTRIPRWSAIAEQEMRGGNIDTRVDYGNVPEGRLGVFSIRMTALGQEAWVRALDNDLAVDYLIPYYPGWTAYLYEDIGPDTGDLNLRKGKLLAILPIKTQAGSGLMRVPVPKGDYFLDLRLQDTPIRKLGWALSLISLGVCGALLLGRRRFAFKGMRREAD